jgi:hypothetical protein
MQFAMSIKTDQLQNLTAVDHYGTVHGMGGRGLRKWPWEGVVWAVPVKIRVSGKVL